jgi:hypothetical protein
MTLPRPRPLTISAAARAFVARHIASLVLAAASALAGCAVGAWLL